MINSKKKGARIEREWAKWLRDQGISARRGRQYSGDPTAPDVITSLTGIHFEVKGPKRFSPWKYMEQCEGDAGNAVPVVSVKANNKEWLVILKAKDIERFVTEWGRKNGSKEEST